MRIENIFQYFAENNFNESLVIKFSHKIDTITLVCDYVGDVLKAIKEGHKTLSLTNHHYQRDLRKLSFKQVTNYKREEGSNKFLQDLKNDYDASLHRRSVTISQINILPKGISTMLCGAILSFGDFGICTFEFRHFEVEQKLVQSIGKVENSNEYAYIDVSNKKLVDFYNPFD